MLEKFIHIIKHSGISLRKKKAEIMKPQIEFVGIQIDRNGIKMQNHIVQKIITLDENIDTKKKLQSFQWRGWKRIYELRVESREKIVR